MDRVTFKHRTHTITLNHLTGDFCCGPITETSLGAVKSRLNVYDAQKSLVNIPVLIRDGYGFVEATVVGFEPTRTNRPIVRGKDGTTTTAWEALYAATAANRKKLNKLGALTSQFEKLRQCAHKLERDLKEITIPE